MSVSAAMIRMPIGSLSSSTWIASSPTRPLAKGTDRPQLRVPLEYAREGDTIVVHSMDRLARNIDDLRRLVLNETRRGVHVQFIKENLTFTGEDSPMANLMLSVLGAVAQFERDLIRERQREGIALAKQRGVYRGRARALAPERAEELRRRVAAGEKKSSLAREFGISRETLYQYVRRGNAEARTPLAVAQE